MIVHGFHFAPLCDTGRGETKRRSAALPITKSTISASIQRAAERLDVPNLIGGGNLPSATIRRVAERFNPSISHTLSIAIRRTGGCEHPDSMVHKRDVQGSTGDPASFCGCFFARTFVAIPTPTKIVAIDLHNGRCNFSACSKTRWPLIRKCTSYG